MNIWLLGGIGAAIGLVVYEATKPSQGSGASASFTPNQGGGGGLVNASANFPMPGLPPPGATLPPGDPGIIEFPANGPPTSPPAINSTSDFNPDTFTAAQALDQELLANGCQHAFDPQVQSFQQVFMSDPMGWALNGGDDGKFGNDTWNALVAVLGASDGVPDPCF